MERLQDGGKIINGECDALFLHHLRDAFTGKLIEGIKTQMSHLQVSLLSLHAGNTLVYLHQIMTFYQLWHQAHQLIIGMGAFASTGTFVISQVMQFLHDTLHLGMVSLFVFGVGITTTLAL